MARCVHKLDTVNLSLSNLTHAQAVALFSPVHQRGSTLRKLNIRGNNLAGVPAGLLARATIRLQELNMANCQLTRHSTHTSM